jgi:hypothetical protein
MMGSHKQALLEFQHFPEHVILDLEDIFWRLRCDVARIWPMDIDWDLFFQVMFDGISRLEHYLNPNAFNVNHATLKDCALNIARGEFGVFEDIYDPDKIDLLEKIIYRAGLEIKDRLTTLVAYHRGVFPYTYRTMISDGCLFFSKNESIYDTRVPDLGF